MNSKDRADVPCKKLEEESVLELEARLREIRKEFGSGLFWFSGIITGNILFPVSGLPDSRWRIIFLSVFFIPWMLARYFLRWAKLRSIIAAKRSMEKT